MKKLYLLPGMGADSRLYGKEFHQIENLQLLDWPLNRNFYTISALARYIVKKHRIQSHDIIGGTSLGGAVAVEIAKVAGLREIVLISSCLSKQEINWVLDKMHRLGKFLPLRMLQLAAGLGADIFRSKTMMMFSEADRRFMLNMMLAIFKWDGIGSYRAKVCRIHGRNDVIIQCPRSSATLQLKGGHLVVISHAEEIATYLRRLMATQESKIRPDDRTTSKDLA